LEGLRIAHIEQGLYSGRVFTRPDGICISPASKDEVERVNDDRLAGAGLPGQDIETWVKLNREVFYRREITDFQFP
jgi:hypothetical protein